MRSTLTLLSCLACLALFAGAAYAHGGTYQGPGGGGDTDYNGPGGGGTQGPGGGNPNPGGPGGGTTPGQGGGGGTTGPAGGGPAPVRPGGRAGGNSGGRAGGVTPGIKKGKNDESFQEWDWWWDLNDDRYLLLKNKVRKQAAASKGGDTFLGGEEDSIVNVTTSKIRNTIMPTLRIGLKDPYYDARAGAVIALAKASDKTQPEVMAELTAMLKDTDKVVQESTCLALGILGNKAAVPDLLEVAKNTPAGKKLAGSETGDVPTRMRCFASVAIGLIGWREAYSPEDKVLQELVNLVKADVPHEDIQIGPAIALQLVKSQEQVMAILDLFKNPDTKNYVRAHLGVALGKIGAKTAIPELLKGMNDKVSFVAHSSAISLGLLTTRDEKDTVNKLISFAKSSSDRGTRNFSIIALGEIGDPKGKAALIEMVNKGQYADRTFAALALGVMGVKFPEERADSGQAILDTFKKIKNDPEKAALAIALGLLNHEAAVPTLREELTAGGGSQDLKGHICTALGLLNDRESIPAIQELVKQKGDQDLRKRASIALGLLKDPDAVQVLQKVIQESQASKAILGAATVALGYVGDSNAIPVLKDMVENRKGDVQDVTRAFATVALGFLGDKDDIPLLSHIHESSNYLAQSEAVAELLTIL